MERKSDTALGLVETTGLLPLVEAVDAALKAARVTLKAGHKVGGGLYAAALVGDVGAMRAALDAAAGSLARLKAEGRTHLIPRLAEEARPLAEAPEKPDGSTGGPDGGPANGLSNGGPLTSSASQVPAERPVAGPVTPRPKAEPPMVKEEAKAPALKPESPAPTLKPETPVPVKKADAPPKPEAAKKPKPGQGSKKSKGKPGKK